LPCSSQSDNSKNEYDFYREKSAQDLEKIQKYAVIIKEQRRRDEERQKLIKLAADKDKIDSPSVSSNNYVSPNERNKKKALHQSDSAINMSDSCCIVVDSDEDVDDETKLKLKEEKLRKEKEERERKERKRRKFEYVLVDECPLLEAQIDKCTKLSMLNEEQLEYMVKRDINYFLDIFSGHCEHSWRHQEFKRELKSAQDALYFHTALANYSHEQHMAVVRGLRVIFLRGNKSPYEINDYIVKVLMPEALIKICMRIYQCSKQAAEDYLEVRQDRFYPANVEVVPRGSANKPPGAVFAGDLVPSMICD